MTLIRQLRRAEDLARINSQELGTLSLALKVAGFPDAGDSVASMARTLWAIEDAVHEAADEEVENQL